MSLTLSDVWPPSLHLDLFNSVGRYSLTSRFQKWLTICCTFFQDLKLAGSWLSNFPVGRELNGLLNRKWFGVRGLSFSGRSATIVSGLEFNIASVFTKIVLNKSSDNLLEPRMRRFKFENVQNPVADWENYGIEDFYCFPLMRC